QQTQRADIGLPSTCRQIPFVICILGAARRDDLIAIDPVDPLVCVVRVQLQHRQQPTKLLERRTLHFASIDHIVQIEARLQIANFDLHAAAVDLEWRRLCGLCPRLVERIALARAFDEIACEHLARKGLAGKCVMVRLPRFDKAADRAQTELAAPQHFCGDHRHQSEHQQHCDQRNAALATMAYQILKECCSALPSRSVISSCSARGRSLSFEAPDCSSSGCSSSACSSPGGSSPDCLPLPDDELGCSEPCGGQLGCGPSAVTTDTVICSTSGSRICTCACAGSPEPSSMGQLYRSR